MFNGHPAVGLTEAQAAEIKSATDEENERLRQLVTNGVSIFRAAATLKRKTGSIRTQARKIGCPFPTIKELRLKSSHSPDGQQR
jgi:hypothetical protein